MLDKNHALGSNSKLNSPKNFFNRELSWLKFNRRVLDEANVRETPLLERLKFIAITSSNLDEFFMIRVARLKQHQKSGLTQHDITGKSVNEQLSAISKDAHVLLKAKYRYLEKLMQEMEKHNICFKKIDNLNDKGKKWVEKYFYNTIFPVITPLAVDSRQSFPFFYNLTINLAITLEKDKNKTVSAINTLFGKKDVDNTAIIQVPNILPRIVEVPSQDEKRIFIFLEDVIECYCAHFFQGYTIKNIFPFRITRNNDLDIAEEDSRDLLSKIEKSLLQRDKGRAVRLEIGKDPNKHLLEIMMQSLDINIEDIYKIPDCIDATCFFKFVDLPGFEHLRHKPFAAQTPEDFYGAKEPGDIFSLIRKQDILLHHPYESFNPVIDFLNQAAHDPEVLAIKQTLYRVSGDAPIVRALAEAAKNSKQVTVLVELKARFDEENNILWAKRLEEAGCHVIYGLVGLKTHSKITLVVRKECESIKRYIHMGTGNYNDVTAKVYTDFGFFTADDQFGSDASAFFNALLGYSDPPEWNKIVVAPIGLREKFKELIDKEIQFALAGKEGRIIAKMNSLADEEIILKLYEASCAGVKIDLIIRGICSLRPGVAGVSENITVRSIIGQFLEHHRIFYFGNGKKEGQIFLSSADWMTRNFDARVELLFPIENLKHVKRIKNILNLMLADNQKTYIMEEDGNYRRIKKRGKIINSQLDFYKQAKMFSQNPNSRI